MPTNNDANARGGERRDRGVGPDPTVHDELVRSVFDDYISLLQQQNAMRLWSNEEGTPPFEAGVDDLGEGKFLIRRGYEDPDGPEPRISRGDVAAPWETKDQDEDI